MKQTGLNREMLARLLGDDVNLFTNHMDKEHINKGSGNPRRMKRILVWPNITFDIERLEQDSYVQTIHKMINGLNQVRDDLWWE